MLSNPQKSVSSPAAFPSVKAHYDAYRAHAISLHLLADQCSENLEQQKNYDLQQEDSVRGQITVLKNLRGCKLGSIEDAKLMLSLWREEVLQGENEDKLSDTDQIALRIFDFFESQLVNG